MFIKLQIEAETQFRLTEYLMRHVCTVNLMSKVVKRFSLLQIQLLFTINTS
jgi:hypothetical protein